MNRYRVVTAWLVSAMAFVWGAGAYSIVTPDPQTRAVVVFLVALNALLYAFMAGRRSIAESR